ncbi:unnamed protein product [Protopolystoma xenopodis]|uniref:Uncharacterized protein n=1 Tax=Protopolystoma xenopodis TaxID=117903 RepID=A0A448WRV8_9PLAT|nr:unnamed protein product [Protopolystoma xenopodis]
MRKLQSPEAAVAPYRTTTQAWPSPSRPSDARSDSNTTTEFPGSSLPLRSLVAPSEPPAKSGAGRPDRRTDSTLSAGVSVQRVRRFCSLSPTSTSTSTWTQRVTAESSRPTSPARARQTGTSSPAERSDSPEAAGNRRTPSARADSKDTLSVVCLRQSPTATASRRVGLEPFLPTGPASQCLSLTFGGWAEADSLSASSASPAEANYAWARRDGAGTVSSKKQRFPGRRFTPSLAQLGRSFSGPYTAKHKFAKQSSANRSQAKEAMVTKSSL